MIHPRCPIDVVRVLLSCVSPQIIYMLQPGSLFFSFQCFSLQALNKKENKDLGSPDGDSDYSGLTPQTEAKYQRINSEFEQMMRRTGPLNNHMSVSIVTCGNIKNNHVVMWCCYMRL